MKAYWGAPGCNRLGSEPVRWPGDPVLQLTGPEGRPPCPPIRNGIGARYPTVDPDHD